MLGALVALSILLLSGVLSWDDCLSFTPAWDTLLWFSLLVSMCNALASSGLVGQFAAMVGSALAAAKLGWMASFALLHSAFFWCHCEWGCVWARECAGARACGCAGARVCRWAGARVRGVL